MGGGEEGWGMGGIVIGGRGMGGNILDLKSVHCVYYGRKCCRPMDIR